MGFFNLSKAVKYLSPLKIDSARCLRVLSPLSNCYKCIDICPKQGLSLIDGAWQYEECNDCGLCAAVCPQKVFAFEREKLATMHEKKVLLACTENPDIPAGAMECHCLQQFTIEEILAATAQNEALAIYAPPEICEKCAKGFWADALKMRLANLGLTDKVIFLKNKREIAVWQHNGAGVGLSRRGFFESLSAKGQQELKNLAQKTVDETKKTLNDTLDGFREDRTFMPEKITSERGIVRQMLQNKANTEVNLPYHALKNTSCIFCTACTRLCPTESLKVNENDTGEKYLTFAPDLCNECDLCIDICPTKGFYWDELPVSDFLGNMPQTLAEAEKQICQKCGEEFWQYPKGEGICRFCRD